MKRLPGTDKRERQQRIREILARNEIHSQEQLAALLQAESITTTQATLSRDLRELGASRSAGGYRIARGRPRPELRPLGEALRSVLTCERSGTLVVLRTASGRAPALALELERAGLPQALGTISGLDTIFVATASAGAARELIRLLERLAR